ncbi:MAG: polyprenyl synthetase family protein [Ferruginibacter sp.]
MKFVNDIIGPELKIFEEKFAQSVKADTSLLNTIMNVIIKRKGKQLRPMFVFLSAKLNGDINESTYRAAALVELLHTATLVHDDVVDESYERRGFFSINALWKNKVAVLVGDYLLSRGLLLATENNDFAHLQILSQAVQQMSEGELLQMEKSRKLNIDEAVYFEIIKNKTASLLSSACAAGAYSSSKSMEKADVMKKFGELAGIAFQIKDDLFDYGTANVGKPTGNDIQEKKITLPLIYTLQHLDKSSRKEIIYILKNQNKNKEKVQQVIQTVTRTGGIEYASGKMMEYRQAALDVLSAFPITPTRGALEQLVNYTTDRKY